MLSILNKGEKYMYKYIKLIIFLLILTNCGKENSKTIQNQNENITPNCESNFLYDYNRIVFSINNSKNKNEALSTKKLVKDFGIKYNNQKCIASFYNSSQLEKQNKIIDVNQTINNWNKSLDEFIDNN